MEGLLCSVGYCEFEAHIEVWNHFLMTYTDFLPSLSEKTSNDGFSQQIRVFGYFPLFHSSSPPSLWNIKGSNLYVNLSDFLLGNQALDFFLTFWFITFISEVFKVMKRWIYNLWNSPWNWNQKVLKLWAVYSIQYLVKLPPQITAFNCKAFDAHFGEILDHVIIMYAVV